MSRKMVNYRLFKELEFNQDNANKLDHETFLLIDANK